MMRAVPSSLAAGLLVAAVACSRSPPSPPGQNAGATAAPEAPVVVGVVAAPGSGPEADAWARALRAAVGARAGELRLAAGGEGASLTVRIDSVQADPTFAPEPAGEGETMVMRGAVARAERTREFTLAYRGDPRPQAEALARHLRGIAKEMSAPASQAPEDSSSE